MRTTTNHSLAITLGVILLATSTVAEAGARYYGGVGRGAVVGDDRAVARGPRGVVATGPNATVAARRRPLPRGYIATVPRGYRRVMYGGYNCYFVGGIYYRPVIYQGATVYVVVN